MKTLFRFLIPLQITFRFDKNMTIIEILNLTKRDIKENIDLLEKDYLRITGRKVCRTCPSDVQSMILTLKNHYKMTQFKFKRPAAMYKNKKGDKTTISNGNITDEKAIEFLKTKPERIELFSDYPSNWKKMIDNNFVQETEEEKEKRLAIEAELEEKRIADLANETPEEKELRLAAEKREDLMKIGLKNLRIKYPNIKATSTKNFVDKVLAE